MELESDIDLYEASLNRIGGTLTSGATVAVCCLSNLPPRLTAAVPPAK